jgi:hypothetical protein
MLRNPPELSPLITVYQTRRLQFRHFWGLFLCGFFFILIPLAYGLFRLYMGYTQYGPAVGYARGLPWLAFAGIAFVAWLIGLIARLRSPQYKIFLYKNRLQFEGNREAKKSLGLESCLDWEALSGISVDSIGGKVKTGLPSYAITSQRVKLLLSNGKEITLTESSGQPGGLINLPELVSRVKASLYPRLTPRLKTEFSSGQRLSFGPLLVQKEGVQFKNRSGTGTSPTIPWEQFGHITVKSGYLVVELSKSSALAAQKRRFPISQIPNLELLLQIIKENVEG